ncbi:MAG: hypothetical protein JWL73_3226 [Actinomycetia bacterium]|nr:hypothetical protein [Actinomycetes bacterium]
MTELATALVALIEPHPGRAVAFNRWYERDHFYSAVMAGPGVMSGARWVAPRAAKATRIGNGLFGNPDGASFLATFWLEPGGQARWDEWVPGRMSELVEQDRMFTGRDHVRTAVYERAWEVQSPSGPPIDVALDRRYAGVIVLAVDREVAGDLGAVEDWHRELVAAVPALDVSVGLTQLRLVLSVLADPAEDPERHALLLAFTDDDPVELWRDEVRARAVEFGAIGFGGPFLATVPGTDTYVDDL